MNVQPAGRNDGDGEVLGCESGRATFVLTKTAVTSMYSLIKPDGRTISEFLIRRAAEGFNYPDVGQTAGWMPEGYDHHQVRIELGCGDAVFHKATQALRNWQQFQVGWVAAIPNTTALQVGETIAIRARLAGLWNLSACRIVEVFGDERADTRFGFAMGTLPDHPEQGEERFMIEILPDGRVIYRVRAFFRPNTIAMRIAWPFFRRLFNRFRHESA